MTVKSHDGFGLLGEDREVESGGAASEADDLHDGKPPAALRASFSPVSSASAASRSCSQAGRRVRAAAQAGSGGHEASKFLRPRVMRVAVALYEAGHSANSSASA